MVVVQVSECRAGWHEEGDMKGFMVTNSWMRDPGRLGSFGEIGRATMEETSQDLIKVLEPLSIVGLRARRRACGGVECAGGMARIWAVSTESVESQ